MIYFLTGREPLLKREFVRDLKAKHFKDTSQSSLNFQEFHASSDPVSGFLEFAQTAPFLSELRIAVVWEVEELDAEEKEALLAFLGKKTSQTLLVFSSDETVANLKKDKFLSALAEASSVVPCHAPFEKDLPGWVQSRARKESRGLDGEAVRLLIEKVGREPALLQNALEQVFLYAHPRTQITAKDIEALIGKSGQEDAFSILEDLLKKDARGALSRAEILFKEGVRVPELIGILAGQLDRLKKALQLAQERLSPSEICTTMRVPFFQQEKFVAQIRRTALGEVIGMQKRLLDCDSSIKEGKLAERLAIQKFILGN